MNMKDGLEGQSERLSVRKAMVVWAKMVPTVKKAGMVSEIGPAGKSGGCVLVS